MVFDSSYGGDKIKINQKINFFYQYFKPKKTAEAVLIKNRILSLETHPNPGIGQNRIDFNIGFRANQLT